MKVLWQWLKPGCCLSLCDWQALLAEYPSVCGIRTSPMHVAPDSSLSPSTGEVSWQRLPAIWADRKKQSLLGGRMDHRPP